MDNSHYGVCVSHMKKKRRKKKNYFASNKGCFKNKLFYAGKNGGYIKLKPTLIVIKLTKDNFIFLFHPKDNTSIVS